jgi:hypothetical protein
MGDVTKRGSLGSARTSSFGVDEDPRANQQVNTT